MYILVVQLLFLLSTPSFGKLYLEFWNFKPTDNWVDDYPGTAEGKDADSDQDLQEPLPEGGKISRVGDVDIPSTDCCLKSK